VPATWPVEPHTRRAGRGAGVRVDVDVPSGTCRARHAVCRAGHAPAGGRIAAGVDVDRLAFEVAVEVDTQGSGVLCATRARSSLTRRPECAPER
jgi:hypothetical protein